MSEHEAELRRRLATDGADTFDIICWFLDVVGAQACVDGGPEPDLAWFEREFLKSNVEYYHEERVRRMTLPELLNELATEGLINLDQPRIDVSDWSDLDLTSAITDDRYGDSAVAELVKRANAKRATMSDYVKDAVLRDHPSARRA